MKLTNKHITLFLCLCLLIPLSACGIKPAHVEPPDDAQHNEFPRQYPDPMTDPQPGMDTKNIL